MKKVDLIVDMQFGSTGKGLLAGYLAKKNKYDVVVNANMPNAGHTFIDNDGNVMIHKVLPNGIVSPSIKYVLIGPGSVFCINRLMREIEHARECGYMKNDTQVLIHPNAVPLDDWMKNEEEISNLGDIGSTKQGSAEAMIGKIRREVDRAVIADDVFSSRFEHGVLNAFGISIASHDRYKHVLISSDKILAEGAQGYSLGINERFYPYCTSRDCGPARFLSDMGIPIHMLNKVIGTARTYPIRVGGNSGGHYDDQREISWVDIGVEPETTTVTGRERRVFTFSRQQILDAIWAMSIDEIFMNFMNYVTNEEYLAIVSGTPILSYVKYCGHGPAEGDIRENQI